jgi:hypothetical protein
MNSHIGALIAFLVGVSIIWQVLRYYRAEKQPRWKRE